jgi:hypothetical protein
MAEFSPHLDILPEVPTQTKRRLAWGTPIWWRDTGAEARVVAPIESCADYKDGRKVHAARWVPALPQCVFLRIAFAKEMGVVSAATFPGQQNKPH